MARTLIGELLLRVKADTREAKTVSDALKQIEAHSKSLANAPWGAGMQRSLEKLKATPREMDMVRRSWMNLVQTMERDNLDKALRKSQISAWRQATVSHLTAVRAQVNHLHEAGKRVVGTFENFKKMALLAGGGYTGVYVAQEGLRESLTAASRERVQQAEMKYAGLSEAERKKINSAADTYVGKYNLNRAEVLEVLKDSSLNAVDTDTALSMADPMMRAMIVLKNLFGRDGAVNGLRAFNKAMDNMGVQDPDLYTKMLEGYVRSQQVIGKDISPESYAQAIKFARAPGKAYGKDFIAMWLPYMAAETGGSDAGGKIRAAFDNLASGKTPKAQLELQDELGLRDGVVRNSKGKIVEAGTLTEANRFYENPLEWMNGVLKPALVRQGVDVNNPGEMAAYVGKIVGNRLAGDMLFGALEQYDQYKRQKEKRGDNAYGLKAADTLQQENPFAGYDAFKDAASNLAAAVVPIDTITSGLNKLATGINAFQQKLRDGDGYAWSALTATGVAAGGAAFGVGSMIWNLMTAGTNLNAAAVSLEAAAVSLSKGGVADAVGDVAQKGGGKAGGAGWGTWAFLASLPFILSGSDANNTYANASEEERQKQRDAAAALAAADHEKNGGFWSQMHRYVFGDQSAPQGADGRDSSLDSFIDGPQVSPRVSSEQAVYDAQIAGEDIKNALNITVGPTVETSGIDALQAKLRACIASLDQLRAGIPSTVSDLSNQLNRSFADHQLTVVE